MTEEPTSAERDELPAAFRGGNSMEGVLPILAFVLGDQLGDRLFGDTSGDRIAIVAMTLASAWAVVQRHRRGESIGWWIPSVAGYLFVRGIAGLIWGEDVFLAIGIGLKVSLGVAALVSVMIGRALAGELAPLVLPFSDSTRSHLRYRSTMRDLTLAYAVYQLISVGFEIWLLGETSSGTGFLVIRTLVGTVAGFVGFILAVLYADRRMRAIPEFPGVLAQFEQIGAALEASKAERSR